MHNKKAPILCSQEGGQKRSTIRDRCPMITFPRRFSPRHKTGGSSHFSRNCGEVAAFWQVSWLFRSLDLSSHLLRCRSDFSRQRFSCCKQDRNYSCGAASAFPDPAEAGSEHGIPFSFLHHLNDVGTPNVLWERTILSRECKVESLTMRVKGNFRCDNHS